MAVLHFEQTPYRQNLFGVSEEEIQGKFDGWEKNARYIVRLAVVLQVDSYNVSDNEHSVSPDIIRAGNISLVNIYKTFEFEGSFEEFNAWYAQQEYSIQYYVNDLANNLNNARQRAGLNGNWYINYSWDDREVEVHKP